MASQYPEQAVVVRDIQMSFWSMIVFMVKWAVASISALLILMVIGALAGGVLAGLFGGAVGTP